MLTISGLTIAYGPIQVVHGVTMTVDEGRIVALIGPNGAGKSSVLRAVSGLIRPTAGDILFLGANIVGVPPHEIAMAGVAHVMEGRHLFGGLSVEDNLILAGNRDDRSSAGNLEAVYQRWPRLRERREQLAGTLSGGEQQMLAIGRALMARPRLLILDEPSWGLAPRIVRELMDTFVRLRRQGVTILLCEQMANLALKICENGYVLTSGRVALEGTSQELLANPELQATYLGGRIGKPSSIASKIFPVRPDGSIPSERREVSISETKTETVPIARVRTEIDRSEKEKSRQEREGWAQVKTGGLGDLVTKPRVPSKEDHLRNRYSARERRREMKAREFVDDKRRRSLEEELVAIRKEISKLNEARFPAQPGKAFLPESVEPGGPDRDTLEAIRRQRQEAHGELPREAMSSKAGASFEDRSGRSLKERARREREAARRRELSLQETDLGHRPHPEHHKGAPGGRATETEGPRKDRAKLEEQRRQRQSVGLTDQGSFKPEVKPSRERPDRNFKEMQRRQKQAGGPGRSGNRGSS